MLTGRVAPVEVGTARSPDPPSPPSPPPPVTAGNMWDLKADPGALRRAAQGWRDLARAARTQAQAVDAPARRIYNGPWAGDAADSYHEHRARLTGDVRDAGALADRVAGALEAAATSLASAQGMLTTSWSTVTAKCPVEVNGELVTFRPDDEADATAVESAIAEAREIRADLDDKLLDGVSAVAAVQPELAAIGAAWMSVAEGTADPFTMPPEASGPGTILDVANNRFIVNSGPGHDNVEVRVDPATGERTVVVSEVRIDPDTGERIVIGTVEYPVPDGMAITVRAGEGQDVIAVPSGTRLNLTLLGGEGDDTIGGGDGHDRVLAGDGIDIVEAGDGDDRVSGGADRDYLDGQAGDDTLDGGTGDDTVYGLSGDDRISGGDGRDYLEGATGDDTVDGGADADTVSGGRDDDTLRAGGGDDVVYGGDGTDTVTAGTGTDTAYTQPDDETTEAERVVTVELTDVGSNIRVEGSPEFVERVQADLDMLRSSPRGQLMLAEMDGVHDETGAIAKNWPVLGGIAYQGDTVTIVETTIPNGSAGYEQNALQWAAGHDHYTIQYNPRFHTVADGPSVAVLYHEMAHVYDFHNDTSVDGSYDNPDDPDRMPDGNGNLVGVPNAERQAAGLPIDADGDGDYEIDPDHPYDYTENGLREEMGAPHRPTYGQ